MKKTNFIMAPGYILIDPLSKEEKSSMMAVVDGVDKAYKGHVVSIGDPLPDQNGNIREFFAKVGDLVKYSIQGCEIVKLEYGDDKRHEFVIAPFGRVLMKI